MRQTNSEGKNSDTMPTSVWANVSLGFRVLKLAFLDVSYDDPLGPKPERPKTSAGRKNTDEDNPFEDYEIGDDLLPE